MGSRNLFAAISSAVCAIVPAALVSIAVALLCAPSTARADIDPGLFGDLHWRSIGPYRGGRVLTVAGVPGDPRHYYFGSVNGGIWETSDAGRTWKPIFDSQPVGTIGALAVAGSDPNVIYAGSGEADMRSDIAQGNGVYKSTDAGRTWVHIGLGDTRQVGRILIHPRDPNVVYVAALGHPYGPNAERGVFRSRDGGKSWQKVLFKDANTGAIDLAFQPGDPNVIYASLWQTRRPPWNVYPPSNGPGSGLYKSSDGGDTWQQVVGHGFPAKVGHVGLGLSAAAPRRVYAMVDGDAGGLYRSDDGGANWKYASADQRIWQRGWYFGQITADPKNADRIYVMNTIVLRSDDGGANFVPLKGDQTGDDFHALWIDSADSDHQILGSDQGAQVTLNGGVTWSSWHNQPTAQIYRVSTDNRFPYWVYGAQQDSGAVSLPSRGASYDGINMTQFREIAPGGESDNIAPDPRDHDVIFGGRVDKLDMRTQQVRHVDPTLAAEPELYRATWTLPLVFSRRDPQVLYFGNQRIYRTADGGEHWQVISPDLTRENPAVPATLDAPAVADNLGTGPRRGVVYAIAPSRVADHELWAGTDDGLIWRTRDEGAHWDNVTPPALTAWSKIGILDASPFDADSVYAAVDRHRLDDFKPYIYRTHDGGKSWQLIANGIGAGSAVNVVRADPVRRGLLYAGTEKGVYVSFDDGDHWQPLQSGLPVTSVRDLVVHDTDLVIATHGRGFYILDDIAALRQADAKVATATAWLYAPTDAARVHHPQFTGTPLPKDEPMAANPPDGAMIDYVLQSAAKAVTLEIIDAGGAVVRRYSSDDQPKPADPAKLETAPEWQVTPVTLSTAAGMHRFVWPLRHAAGPALSEGNKYADGVWAPPGKYHVALTVDGQRLTQSLTVRPDPRISLADEAYAQQYALARQVDQQREQVSAALHAVAQIQTDLSGLRDHAPSLGRDIDAALAELHALAGTRPSPNAHNGWAFPAGQVQSLRWVGEALEKLEHAVDDADAAPSPDCITGSAKLQPLTAAALAAWSDWQAKQLPAFNAKLKRAGRAPLVVKQDG